eukprot:3125078-Prymnesium_polylepis.1
MPRETWPRGKARELFTYSRKKPREWMKCPPPLFAHVAGVLPLSGVNSLPTCLWTARRPTQRR